MRDWAYNVEKYTDVFGNPIFDVSVELSQLTVEEYEDFMKKIQDMVVK